jgi:recombination protein RecR
MRERVPETLKALVEQLARLPGFGPKSAMRAAMCLLKWPPAETRRLGNNIVELRDRLHLCSRCGGLCELDPCPVCSDPERSDDVLCLVAEWDSMLALDEGGFYRGRYMILGGLLSPPESRNIDDLEMERLIGRLKEGRVKELILALGATVEADNTASFVHARVAGRFPELRVTRLAQGIPLGAEVKFMDHETLRRSWQYRQIF